MRIHMVINSEAYWGCPNYGQMDKEKETLGLCLGSL